VVNLDEAYAACERQAAAHYENFPVASVLLPRRMRPHIAAIYAFARTADDLADEGDVPAATRTQQLDVWLGGLHTAVKRRATAAPGARASTHDALAATIAACALPVSLFDDLVSAFKQDVVRTRYETWEDVDDYCRRSANPVGRLVLRVAGIDDPALDRASDAVCTALQLTNFWQDFAIDWKKGRLYLPREEWSHWNAREEDLHADRWTPEWGRAIEAAVARTRALFDQGRPVCDGVNGRLRLELRFTWLGGRRILDSLVRLRFNGFSGRPALGRADVPALAWQAITWRQRE
jgi:hydroxysqualene synthase